MIILINCKSYCYFSKCQNNLIYLYHAIQPQLALCFESEDTAEHRCREEQRPVMDLSLMAAYFVPFRGSSVHCLHRYLIWSVLTVLP